MKKIILIIFLIFVSLSCNNDNNKLTAIDKLQGMWQINNEPKIFTVSNNQWAIIQLYNKLEANGYIFIPKNIPSINQSNTLLWCNQTDSGLINIISQVNDVTIENRESYLIKGMPYSNHTTDTLHRIIDISIK